MNSENDTSKIEGKKKPAKKKKPTRKPEEFTKYDSDVYVGIDNGLSGALVVVDKKGTVIAKTQMPVKAKRTGREVDAVAVAQWIATHTIQYDRVAVILEIPGKFGRALALASMHDSYGCLRSLLDVLGYTWFAVNPQKWQKVMIPKCAKGETKPRALEKARAIWPEETWFPTPRCKTPNPDMIDAALMAEYGRIEKL